MLKNAITIAVVTGSMLFMISQGCSETEEQPHSGQTQSSPEQQQLSIAQNVFSNSKTEFEVKIFYDSDIVPYTGPIGLSGNDTWDISKESLSHLFKNHSRDLTIPSSISEMQSLNIEFPSAWAFEELKALGDQHAPALVDKNKITISVFFVKGTYQGNPNILGVHLGGTHFCFVFKDIVTNVGGDSVSQRYVEQATVVHEIGHTVGLVNNGVPMTSNHEDSDHPKHTVNSKGVMYWAIENSQNILSSLTNFITNKDLNLFGIESLSDGNNYQPN